jgi:ABC-type branched-subunit amino acid transport system substrate-binding protein
MLAQGGRDATLTPASFRIECRRLRTGGVPMRRLLAVTTVAFVVTALVGVQAVTAGAGGGSRQGGTDKEIRVGGLASPANDTLNVAYEDGFDGVEAYFDKVNKAGGVFGRKLKLVSKLSDQGQPSANIRAVRSLVEEKKVFAVLPIMTNSFTLGGRYLAEQGIPSFGINVDPAWCGSSDEQTAVETAYLQNDQFTQCPRPNLFGEKGSFLCFECPGVGPSFLAEQLGIKRVAVFGYTHISSTRCVNGTTRGFEELGIEVVHKNQALEFGFSVSDIAADVQAMIDNDVQMVSTCMEFNGGFKFSQALKEAGKDDVVFYAPEGYKESTVEKYGDELNNWFFRLGFAPWQAKGKDLPKGTKEFLAAMEKRGVEPSEHNQAGWINAALLVEGIKAAGENFTEESVVDAINQITDFTAGGILPGINWTQDGHGPGPEACDAWAEAVDGKFEPRFGKPGRPFVCFDVDPFPSNLDSPYYKPLGPGETGAQIGP